MVNLRTRKFKLIEIMELKEIRRIAEIFTNAIEKIKYEFPMRDRMHGFPKGCCDDASDLFARYLWDKYGLTVTRIDGAYYTDNPEENDWHTWLEVEGYVVDLTAYQYKQYDSIYVGSYDKFHRRYEAECRHQYKGFYDLNDGCWERMKGLYDMIVDNMQTQ